MIQQHTIEQAWQRLQSAPSSVEQPAASFAALSSAERVLALAHTPECLQVLQSNYAARQSYIATHPGHCTTWARNRTGRDERFEIEEVTHG